MPRLRRVTRNDLDRIGDRAAAIIARRMWGDIVRAYRSYGELCVAESLWETVLCSHVEALADFLAAGMKASHVLGRLRSFRAAAGRIGGPRRFAASPYDPAVEFVQARAMLSAEQLAALEAMYTPEAARVATGLGAAMNARLAATVSGAIADNVHVREGIARLQAANAGTRALAETLFRTQHQLAWMAGRLNANADPDIDEIVWGYEYVAILDSRVRPTHRALHGTKLPKGHPRWREIMPPNGYNCRCDVIEIFKDEQRAVEKAPPDVAVVDGQRVIPGADGGFEFNPGAVFDDTMAMAMMGM